MDLSFILFLTWAYMAYALTWYMKAFYKHRQWGVPIHRFGYFTFVSIIIWSVIFVFTLDYDLLGNWFLEMLFLLIMIIGAPPFFYFLSSRKYWIPQRSFEDRKIKNGWKKMIDITTFLSVIIVLSWIIMFIKYSIQFGISEGFTKSELLFILGTLVGIIQSFYLGYEKSFDNTLIEYKRDNRKPYHLIIRSFTSDFVPFIWGLVPLKKISIKAKPPYQLSYPAFHEFISAGIKDESSDVVLIGDPLKFEPLIGVKNAYYTDDTWQKNFINWAKSSTSIIAIPENTNGLDFELNAIWKLNLIGKFFIVIPYTNFNHGYLKLWRRIMAFIRNYKKTDLDEFKNRLEQIGFKIDSNHFSQGSLVAFNSHGQSICLLSNSKQPHEYLKFIHEWVTQKNNSIYA